MSHVDPELDRLVGRPRAERVRWLLGLLAGGAADARPEDVAPLLGSFYRRPEGFPRMIGFWGRRLGVCAAVDARLDAEGVLELGLRDAKDRPWALRCRIGASPPYPLEYHHVARPLPPDVQFRRARDADAEALARLERDCPIERDDGSCVTLVRGRSVFDQLRLAEWAGLWLAEERGIPVACDATAAHRARTGGRDVDLVYRFHTRVAPSHRRLGLNETMTALVSEERFRKGISFDGFYVYIDPRYRVIRAWSPNTPWRARPFSALLRCDALAGSEAGRPATHADAPRIAELLNAAHARKEFFLPYDVSRLGARLARIPERYGFAHVLLTDEAVVGVWEDGEQRILERAGLREESRRATALDWGFAPGADLGSFEALLRAWCGRLARGGITHLSVFASEASPAAQLLRTLAETVVEVELQCSLPEPADSGERGVFVDPVYY
jgi:hypothetical protein